MTKKELLNSLENIRNNFLFGTLATRIIPEQKWKEISTENAKFKRSDQTLLEVPLIDLSQIMLNKTTNGRELLLSEFESSLMRSILSESHEIILKYCEETNQFSIYKAQPWFQFMRIIRNICSHKEGGILHKWPHDLLRKNITSVTWKNRIINTSMIGQHIEFSMPDALDNWLEIRNFTETKLN